MLLIPRRLISAEFSRWVRLVRLLLRSGPPCGSHQGKDSGKTAGPNPFESHHWSASPSAARKTRTNISCTIVYPTPEKLTSRNVARTQNPNEREGRLSGARPTSAMNRNAHSHIERYGKLIFHEEAWLPLIRFLGTFTAVTNAIGGRRAPA